MSAAIAFMASREQAGEHLTRGDIQRELADIALQGADWRSAAAHMDSVSREANLCADALRSLADNQSEATP